jgi:UDP-N-acetylglucosamine transferase subunit ALG13
MDLKRLKEVNSEKAKPFYVVSKHSRLRLSIDGHKYDLGLYFKEDESAVRCAYTDKYLIINPSELIYPKV